MITSYTPNYKDYEDYVPPPLGGSFNDWMVASRAYALENYPHWSSEAVTDFASDIAWQMEGMVMTDSTFKKAVSDWTSGRNHYHKV